MTTLRTVNYYPANQPGPAMWSQFAPASIGRDMLVARAIGFQALRIFLPVSGAAHPDTFDLPQPTPVQLDRLAQVCALAKLTGLRLHLSLFDYWGSYGHVDQCTVWVQAIAATVPAELVAVVELQNETQWATYPAAGPWAKAMLPVLRSAFPGKPVSVSCTDAPETHLAAARKALGSLPSFYDWHAYPYNCPDEATLDRAIAIARPRALHVGEFGCPSRHPSGNATEAGQAAWMTAALAVFAARRIVPAPWCLYDYTADWTGSGSDYGLLTADGRIKPAGQLYL